MEPVVAFSCQLNLGTIRVLKERTDPPERIIIYVIEDPDATNKDPILEGVDECEPFFQELAALRDVRATGADQLIILLLHVGGNVLDVRAPGISAETE